MPVTDKEDSRSAPPFCDKSSVAIGRIEATSEGQLLSRPLVKCIHSI
jgi:hypothetical protein